MDPHTEASLAFPHDGLYGQFNSVCCVITAMFIYSTLVLFAKSRVKMELEMNIVVKGHYNDYLFLSNLVTTQRCILLWVN